MRVSQWVKLEEAGIEAFIEDNQMRISLGFTDINVAERATNALKAAGMKSRYVRLDEDLGEIYEITDVENDS